MHFRPLSLLVVPLFASLIMGSAQVLAAPLAEKTVAEIGTGWLLVFGRDMELDTADGTINFAFRSGGFLGTGTGAACFFISEQGATSMAERQSMWRFRAPPRYGWNDYTATLDSMTDGRQIKLVCRKDHDEKIPLSSFLEAFTKAGVQVSPPNDRSR